MNHPSVLDEGSPLGHEKTGLRGTLGITSIVFMVVATCAPLTIMVANTPLLISMGNGAGAPFDVLVGTAIMLLFTIGFVRMAPYISNAGAFYAYIQKGMGRSAGLGAATMASFSYFFILVGLEVYLGFALGELFFNFFAIDVPWPVLSVVVVVVIGIFGYRNIELSAKFLGLALILEVLTVLAVNAAVFFEYGITGMDIAPFTWPVITQGSPGLGIMFAIYSFISFEATVIYREEARNPQHTIPLATYIAVLMIGSFCTISMWFVVIGFGADNVAQLAKDHPAELYVMLTERYFSKVGHDIVLALVVTSLFACVLCLHNIVVRYQYIFGRFGVLHHALSSVHEQHGSPHVSSLIQTATSMLLVLALAMIGLDPVTQVYPWGATTGTLGYMTILSLACISVVLFFWNHPVSGTNTWNVKIAPLGGLAGLLFCLWIAISNLPALIGEEASGLSFVSLMMILVIVSTFLLGFGASIWMRWCRPARYERLRELA